MKHLQKSLLPLLAAACGWMSAVPGASAKSPESTASKKYPALANATVLIIRHAEKPDSGSGLSPAGQKHAVEYIQFFKDYRVNGTTPIHLTALFATADSSASQRPRLTLLPLSQAIGLPIDTQYKDADYANLAAALQSSDHGQCILICWHHGKLPHLVHDLGGDRHQLFLPDGKWPDDQYSWVVQLGYDKDGRLETSKVVVEKL